MHLPYVQVEDDLLRHAPDLAVELGVKEADAGWGLILLIQWALSRAPEDRPPSASAVVEGPAAARLIARAARFEGDPEEFVDACCRMHPSPILERTPTGIRVRGLRRYDAAWRKNNPRKAAEWDAERNRSETAPKPERNRPETEAKPKRQTQMQTQKEATTPPATSCAADPALGETLCATFRAERGADYAPSFTDEQAVRRLLQLASGDEAEVARRYRIGLRRTRYPTVSTWADLAKHWNACAADDTPAKSTSPPATRVGATEERPCRVHECEAPGSTGSGLCRPHLQEFRDSELFRSTADEDERLKRLDVWVTQRNARAA